MSHRIRLLPSGHTFTAEANESLLEAGLRSGINLPYSCAGGTCGECRARIVSGSTRPVARHEFAIPESEKIQGTVLLCSCGADSDLVVEVAETCDAGAIPEQHIDARIASARRVGDYLLLQVRTPRTRTLRFLAGQAVTLNFPGFGSLDAAVASCPCNGRVLQFHLHRGAAPAVERLYLSADAGQPLRIDGPFGDFILDETAAAPLMMVAEGDGFAPIKSLVEHFIALEREQFVQLAWIAEPGGHYLENVCRAWQDALDGFGVSLIDRIPASQASSLAEQLISIAPSGADWYLACSAEVTAALRGTSARIRRVYPQDSGYHRGRSAGL